MNSFCGTARGLKTHENRNEPPCRFCNNFQTNPAPATVAPPKPAPARPKRRRRTVTGSTSARPADAHKAAPPPPKAKRPRVCGEPSAWLNHYNRNEPLCDKCRDAKRIYDRERYYARRGLPVPGPPRGLEPCGTYAAANRHRADDEPICPPCRKAKRAYELENKMKTGGYAESTLKKMALTPEQKQAFLKEITDATNQCEHDLAQAEKVYKESIDAIRAPRRAALLAAHNAMVPRAEMAAAAGISYSRMYKIMGDA